MESSAVPIDTDQESEEVKAPPNQLALNRSLREEAKPGQVLVREIVNEQHGLDLPFPLLTYLFYGVLERAPNHLVCVQLVNESIGGDSSNVQLPDGLVMRQSVIPSRQCCANRHSVSFDDALFVPAKRQLVLRCYIPFHESDYDSHSRWFLWHDRLVLSEARFYPSKAKLLQKQADLDYLVMNAMEPWLTSLRAFPPDPSCGEFERPGYDQWFSAWIERNAPYAEALHQDRTKNSLLLVQQITRLPVELVAMDPDAKPPPLQYRSDISPTEKMKRLHQANLDTMSETVNHITTRVRESVRTIPFEDRVLSLKPQHRRFCISKAE